jgi:hypothetical protein
MLRPSLVYIHRNRTPWPESTSELYRPSHRRLSTKLVPTFTDGRCHVVSVTDPYGRILGFIVGKCLCDKILLSAIFDILVDYNWNYTPTSLGV